MGDFPVLWLAQLLCSLLLLAAFENELRGRRFWLLWSVFSLDMCMVPLMTSINVHCGFALSSQCGGPWWPGRRMFGVVQGTSPPSSSVSMLSSYPIGQVKFRLVPPNMLRDPGLGMRIRRVSCTSAVWFSLGRRVRDLPKIVVLLNLFIAENGTKL